MADEIYDNIAEGLMKETKTTVPHDNKTPDWLKLLEDFIKKHGTDKDLLEKIEKWNKETLEEAKEQKEILKKVEKKLTTNPAGEKKSFSVIGSPKVVGLSGKLDGAVYGDEFARSVDKSLKYSALSLTSTLAGGASIMSRILSGAIDQEYEFRTGMDIIAMQTQGITRDAYEMQKAFKATKYVAATTGFDLTTFQNEFMKLAKRGVKDAASITKSGLHLGKVMGLTEHESVSIADTFADWNQHLGLSDMALVEITRGVKEIARFTGITGENLIDVVKHSQQYLDKMRAAGTLTAESTNNIIQLGTEAKKLGVQHSMDEIISGMTDSAGLILSGSVGTQSFLLGAARSVNRTKDLLNGTIGQSKAGIKDMAVGFENMFKQLSGGKGIDEIENMDVEERRRLNFAIQANYKDLFKGVDDMKRSIESARNAGKTYQDRLDDINKSLVKNATVEKKVTLERRKQDLLYNESLKFSNSLATAVANADDFDQVVASMSKKMGKEAWKDQMKDLASIAETVSPSLKQQVEVGNTEGIVKAMSLVAANQIKEKSGGKMDFTNRLTKAINTKDMKMMHGIQLEMVEAQEKLGIEENQSQDPLEKASNNIRMMNENLRGFTGPAIKELLAIAGSTGAMVVLMSGAALHSIFGAEAALSWGRTMSIGFKKYLNIGKEVAPVANAMKNANQWASTAGAMSMAPVTAEGATVVGAEGAAAAGTGSVLGPAILAIEAFMGVIGGITGAIWAADEAVNMFDTNINDLTLSQHYAATAAGAVTGALDFMTFGVFHKFLGTTGAVTKALAQLNDKIPILSMLMAAVDVVMGAVWGVVLLLKNVVMGVFEAFYMILEPFGPLVSAVGDVFKAIISPFVDFSAKLSETGSLFSMVANILGGVGMVIRNLLRAIGFIIAGAITGLLKSVGRIVDGIRMAALGVGQVIQGILTFDFKKIGSGIANVFNGVLKGVISFVIMDFVAIPEMILGAFTNLFTSLGSMIPGVSLLGDAFKYVRDLVGSLVDGIVSPFRWLYDVLVGHSIVPDLVSGIVRWFSILPVKVMKSIAMLPMKIAGTVMSSIKELVVGKAAFAAEAGRGVLNTGGQLLRGEPAGLASLKAYGESVAAFGEEVLGKASNVFKRSIEFVSKHGQPVVKFGTKVLEKATNVFRKSVEFVSKHGQPVVKFGTKVLEKATNVFRKSVDFVNKYGNKFGLPIMKELGQALAKDGSKIASSISGKVLPIAAKAGTMLLETGGQVASKILPTVSKVGSAIGQDVVGGVGKLGTKSIGGVARVIKAIAPNTSELVQGGIAFVKGAAPGLASSAMSYGSKALDFVKGSDTGQFFAKYGSKAISALGGSKLASMLPAVSKLAPTLTKGIPLLGPLIGAATGAYEANDEGRGKVEGALLGVATGGAGTGSMFSGLVGAEKGGAVDKGLGVATSTLGGAATGAVLGTSIFPVVGTAIGAIIGGLVGLGGETYKIATEKTPEQKVMAKAAEEQQTKATRKEEKTFTPAYVKKQSIEAATTALEKASTQTNSTVGSNYSVIGGGPLPKALGGAEPFDTSKMVKTMSELPAVNKLAKEAANKVISKPDLFTSAFSNITSATALGSLFGPIGNMFGGLISGIGSLLGIGTAEETSPDLFTSAFSNITSATALGSLFGPIGNMFGGLISGIGSLLGIGTAEETSPAVQSLPLTDVHARMQQEHAQTNAETNQSGVPELSMIADINQSQLEVMEKVHDRLGTVIDLLGSGGSSGSSSKTANRSNLKSIRTPEYNRWKVGTYDQMAATSVLPD